jgi:two-component system, cell cycle response regulator DivK
MLWFKGIAAMGALPKMSLKSNQRKRLFATYWADRISSQKGAAMLLAKLLEQAYKWNSGPKAVLCMPKKILVVEDNLDARKLIESILTLSGLNVVLAADGQEGLEKAELELPDLIITDIAMPRLNGLGLIKELRKRPDLKRIPILAVTSYGMERAMEAIKSGANRALARPVQNHLLLVFVFDLLSVHWIKAW